MPPISPSVVIGMSFVMALVLFVGTYRLLTFRQRRTMREIREAARAHGWEFRLRRWQGNPTSFTINGQSPSGMPWIMTHGQNQDNSAGCAGVLAIRFPSLAGQTDFAIFPREPEDGYLEGLAARSTSGLGVFSRSSLATSAIGFLRTAQEQHSGVAEFESRYRVLSNCQSAEELRLRGPAPLIDRSLAAGMVHWPEGAVVPQSVAAWRDPFAVRVQARMPGPPSWATVEHLVSLAHELTAHLPPPVPCPVRPGRLDKFMNSLLNS